MNYPKDPPGLVWEETMADAIYAAYWRAYHQIEHRASGLNVRVRDMSPEERREYERTKPSRRGGR